MLAALQCTKPISLFFLMWRQEEFLALIKSVTCAQYSGHAKWYADVRTGQRAVNKFLLETDRRQRSVYGKDATDAQTLSPSFQERWKGHWLQASHRPASGTDNGDQRQGWWTNSWWLQHYKRPQQGSENRRILPSSENVATENSVQSGRRKYSP